jgi:DNA-binding XRE family transcriptional regulator
MKLRSNALLVAYMQERKVSQSELARATERSRQFIHQLVKGEKTTCKNTVGKRIAKLLDVPVEALFLVEESPVKRPNVASSKTRSAA